MLPAPVLKCDTAFAVMRPVNGDSKGPNAAVAADRVCPHVIGLCLVGEELLAPLREPRPHCYDVLLVSTVGGEATVRITFQHGK